MALTDTFIRQVKHTGSKAGDKHSDTEALYLLVTKTGKYWRMNYRFNGKQKTISFGTYPSVSLKSARDARTAAKELMAADQDPSAAKREVKADKVASTVNTFKAVALEWHRVRSNRVTEETRDQRIKHFENHVFSHIGERPIRDIKPPEVLAVIRRVEASGAVYTAGRIRELCSRVFRYAIQTGKTEHNPTDAMRDAIETVAVIHRPALTTKREFGKFLRDLKETTRAEPLTKLCARFGLLTWTRPGELRQAKWEQIDWEAHEWHIPAIAMKTGKHLQAHTVPLSPQAMAVLPLLQELSGHTNRLFPSTGNAMGLISENTIGSLFNRIGYKGKQSHHGLRASARTLLSERGWQREALERQLDHKEANAAVAAYARGEHLEERKKFMGDWADLVETLENGGK